MLKVNKEEHNFHEGMTVKTLLDEKGFVFHRIIVKLNGRIVEDEDFASTPVKDGDNVEAIHIFAGG